MKLSDFDEIQHDKKRGIKFLRLRRNEPKMQQTSQTMLQSWRANCDVAVLVYDTDPVDFTPKDISTISSYIVSYCTKGNSSYVEESDTIAGVIEKSNTQFISCENTEIIKMVRQILNSFLNSRIISKAEASVELLNLDLYWCTESFKHIPLSSRRKLQNSKNATTGLIEKYANRADYEKNKSLKQYIQILSENTTKLDSKRTGRIREKDKKLKTVMIHPIGMNCNPIYPVSHGYAKGTLLMHKPWSSNKRLISDNHHDHVFSEFNAFLKSKTSPIEVKLQYQNAKTIHYRSKHTPPQSENTNNELEDPIEDEEENSFYHAVKNIHRYTKYEGFYTGENDDQPSYDFSQQFHDFDPENESGNWLFDQKQKWEESQKLNTVKKMNINRNTKMPYQLDDVGNNKDQAEIIYTVIKKLKEWLDFPETHKQDNMATFKPLYMTIRGAGGTGKSHVIKILVNAIECMFPVTVTTTCAPTGNAAYNIGGKTCHSFFKVNVKDVERKLSPKQINDLENDIKHLLMIIIDERSLLSMDVLGAAENNCRTCIDENKLWGGVPIVLLFGDDYQLPSVNIGNKGHGANKVFPLDNNDSFNLNATQEIGKFLFKNMADTVKSLSKSMRITQNDMELKNLCQKIRIGDTLSEHEAKYLLGFKLSNPYITSERRQQIQNEAIWIFTTNSETEEHNKKKLASLINRRNPLMNFSYCLSGSQNSTKKKGMHNHFDIQDRKSRCVPLCRGARMSISQNIWQEKGLYNGATGTVIDIRMQQGTKPSNSLPLYVILDMDEYTGPIWDKQNPTYVPIPICNQLCEKRCMCCEMSFLPLNLAFARTLHKFQGKSVGPGECSQIMVFEPGTTSFEGHNPGILYTGLSRAKTLGLGNINQSAFYLTGSNATYDRITNLKYYRRKTSNAKSQYKSINRRQKWVDFLDEREKQTKQYDISFEQQSHLNKWIQHVNTNKIDIHKLGETFAYHRQHSKSYL